MHVPGSAKALRRAMTAGVPGPAVRKPAEASSAASVKGGRQPRRWPPAVSSTNRSLRRLPARWLSFPLLRGSTSSAWVRLRMEPCRMFDRTTLFGRACSLAPAGAVVTAHCLGAIPGSATIVPGMGWSGIGRGRADRATQSSRHASCRRHDRRSAVAGELRQALYRGGAVSGDAATGGEPPTRRRRPLPARMRKASGCGSGPRGRRPCGPGP